jgi:hypothetical protein
MKRLGLGLALALTCAVGVRTEPEDENALRTELKLKNGSLIKGKLKTLATVTLKTRYGELKFPVKDLRSVTWGEVKKEELDTVSAKDGTYKGWVEDLEPLEVDTGFGVLKVPTSAIRTMRVTKPGSTLGDDFEETSLEGWTKFGPSGWTVTDGKLRNQPSGNYDSIQFNEELEGSYTIEVDVTNGNNCGILLHAKDGQNASAVWLSPGNVRVFSGGTWFNNQTIYWGFNYQWNTTIKVKIDVDGSNITVKINDQQVGTSTITGTGGRVGLFDFNGQAQFDNVIITR